MGRKRRADKEEIIDAVGLVIRESGLDALSIDAVAKAAGIGKASVLYDFKSKDGLLAAFVERTIRLHHEAVDQLRGRYAQCPDTTMRALLEYLQSPESQDDLCNGMLVAAAASGNESFRTFLQQTFLEKMRVVEAEAAAPNTSLIAFLAIHGLFALEHFAFCPLEGDVRIRILNEIGQLLGTGKPLMPAAEAPLSNPPELSRKSQVSP
ncbi:TetR/AcrR family transcriptional regulator [Rhizobiaceae bacterium BDR2-2]|uniref:TetR/AcrR family transcriptional regulator n=1 Tax=Ectorhizobium quercum TaxID=2965071 RepID=A0AAE3MYP3_9HYPH|nr:TetR/AcrR family transcriptional regulator [Ectorhizobium quercum]MCX8996075.1 TetR/AcrR family transcriptional regulator [Ectorhizobium quercum]